MKLLIKIFCSDYMYHFCWCRQGSFSIQLLLENQSIQNINSYESSIFRTNILQFENKTSRSDDQKQNADNEMRPPNSYFMLFRQVFHDSAVLYLDGKMTYNGTVYEFDVKKLRELCASKANMVDHGSNSDGHGPMISQINGRTLFVILLWQCKYGISDCYL